MRSSARIVLAGLATAAVVAACGGGGSAPTGSGPTNEALGTLRLSITDAPACGFDHAWVTVERVRVHRSGSAADGDDGWHEVVLPTPLRIDLLELTNGTLLPLGQTELPAGTYTQMRLVLSDNAGTDPPANAVQPSGSTDVVPLTTPSGQQSGLKMNVNLEVPPGQVADFAIDFDGCKSFVRAGKSGKILLKPVLAVIPLLNPAGQRVVGWVDPAMVNPSTAVSVQFNGVPVRATPPSASLLTTDAYGRFTLYPVPAGTYDLVITSEGRVNAVMTGVLVTADQTTVIGHAGASGAGRFNPPLSSASYRAFGAITVGGSAVDTQGVVRALQSFTDGPTVEVGMAAADADTGEYAMMLPADAPVIGSYAPSLPAVQLEPDGLHAGEYTLEASTPTESLPGVEIELAADVETDFVFP